MGQLYFRCVLQVASLVGKEGDATPFTTVTVENISAALHKCGYQSRGWEVMYNGHTGRRLQVRPSHAAHPAHTTDVFKQALHPHAKLCQTTVERQPVPLARNTHTP